MLKNYLLIALRTLHRQKAYAAINLAGLAVGLACCCLLALYVLHETSYDRFHADADRIHRIALFDDSPQTRTPHPMAQALVADFPEVEAAVSLTPIWGPGLTRPVFSVRHGDRRFDETEFLAVDSTFFDVFSFPVVAGDGAKALREPFQILLTRAMAEKYFGDADPLGQTLRLNEDTDFTVGAVLEDVPAASHIHFDFLISYVTLKQLWDGSSFFEWADFGHYNYVRLAESAAPAAVEARIPGWISRYLDLSPEDVAGLERGDIRLSLQPITDIHLRSHLRWELEPNGSAATVYVFVAAALLILLIACINFMNLATARSTGRAREVGVRKALGAHRGQLAGQFLGESVLYSVLAVVGALALVHLALPFFNDLAGTDLSLLRFGSVPLVAGLVGLALVTGVVAGSYPALFLSSFQPAQVLKGRLVPRSAGAAFRKGLVVFQFAVSIVLLVGTLVIFGQLDYLRSQSLGFESEQVVVLPIQDDAMREQVEAVKAELARVPGVLRTSAVSNVPGGRFNRNSIRWQNEPEVPVAELRTDADFLETLGIELAAGRGFSEDRPADAGSAFILNEAAAQRFTWADPVGQEIAWLDEDSTYTGPVIGVAKDFHHASLHDPIAPLAIQVLPGAYNHLLVRVRPEHLDETLAHLETTWTAFSPSRTFSYSFLDDDFDRLYRADDRTGAIVGIFSGLAIFIACLGLFGLAAFTAEQRTKEIGVRKVLGASVPDLVALLSKDFLRLVGIAFVVAMPVAYFAMDRWLADFAYRIDMPWWAFLAAGGVALVLTLATVSTHAMRAATRDPVKALRYE